MKKTVLFILAAVMLFSFAACGAKTPSASKGTYDELVSYMKSKNVISKDAKPVNINETAGYTIDNTEGEMPFSTVATKAEDFDGVWLFYFDESDEKIKEYLDKLDYFEGLIVVGGGANILQLEAYKGHFGIAFGDSCANKDAALEAFKGLAD